MCFKEMYYTCTFKVYLLINFLYLKLTISINYVPMCTEKASTTLRFIQCKLHLRQQSYVFRINEPRKLTVVIGLRQSYHSFCPNRLLIVYYSVSLCGSKLYIQYSLWIRYFFRRQLSHFYATIARIPQILQYSIEQRLLSYKRCLVRLQG